MLKLLTFLLWVAPALVLFLYLLWISKRSMRQDRAEGADTGEVDAIPGGTMLEPKSGGRLS
jgi:cytochrome c-type biogenesis protein CcmH/NrfF